MKRLKDQPRIRCLFAPIMDIKKRLSHDRYLRSPDSWYLKTLKGIHAGKRCFIIGNGPSLRVEDLERLTGEFTFAANRIYEIFSQTKWRPTYYFAVDPEFLRDHLNKIKSYNLAHMFLAIDEKDACDYPVNKLTRIYFAEIGFKIYRQNHWNDFTSYISEDVSNHFSNGFTVTFEAIQMAIYMGFSEIYLLGVDFSYSTVYDAEGRAHVDGSVQDYFSGKTYSTSLQNFASNLHAYRMAREYCDNHGIRICNATRGGKLEVFERVDFDSLFG